MKFGLNLYSLRTLIQTEQDFLHTALRLREMGYASMQFSGAPYDAEMILRVSKESGLPIVLTHVPADRIINDTEALMREHDSFGCHNIGLGHIPPQTIVKEAECKALIADLEAAAERMSKNGFRFFYHNHQHEFIKYGEQTMFDYMLQAAPHFHYTLDTYWLQYGGVNVLEWIDMLQGRIACVHLKDYRIEPKYDAEGVMTEVSPRFAPVGDGMMNFKAIIPALLQAGTKHLIVEQDNAVDFPDALEEVKRSITYLKKEF